jgi:hypothetical protein
MGPKESVRVCQKEDRYHLGLQERYLPGNGTAARLGPIKVVLPVGVRDFPRPNGPDKCGTIVICVCVVLELIQQGVSGGEVSSLQSNRTGVSAQNMLQMMF